MAATYGLLSIHPPTRCGLASFNSALAVQLTDAGRAGGVVRVTATGDDQRPGPGVAHTRPAGSVAGWLGAANALNTYDVAVVQHELGICPGRDGGHVLPLLRRLTVPSIMVLHTVLSTPPPGQRALVEAIAAAAGAVVTMTGTARDRLLRGYAVDPGKVAVIPHGSAEHAAPPAPRRDGPHLLTWGLLGPGKGIEWALRAVQTHPKVAHHGETYRAGLHRLGAQLGIAHAVDHRPEYHDEETLNGLIRSADVVVLPYDSVEQVTSGVLTEAVAAGVPVVATTFPHAAVLLAAAPTGHGRRMPAVASRA